MPTDTNPRVVFERLFGDLDSTDAKVRLARIKRQRSVLDSVLGAVSRLESGLGAGDRAKIDQYLDAIRDVERRIGNAERQSDKELPAVDSPAGIPVTYDEHAKLMYDMQVLAFQTDLTRIATFQIGREQSGMTFPQIGVPDSHHPISHHGGDKDKIAKCAKVNLYHVTLFSHFIEKLRSTPDGEGSLLDNSMIIYGCGMSEGNRHDPRNLPILLVGGAGGQLKGGRHLRYPNGTPLTNLQLSMMHMLGMRMDRFADSTGTVNGLSELSAV